MCTSFISSTLVSLFLFTFMIRRQPSSAHTYTLFPYTTLYRSLIDEPAAVLTYTADWLSYHPAPPLYVGFVQYTNGARIMMEVVDVGPEGIEVGTPLKLTYRIKERDRTRGYNRYFRSEEHTSELQSLMRISYDVFCLKKKKHSY